MRDYVFLDRLRIDSYVEQLGGLIPKRKKKTRKFTLSIKGPRVEASAEDLTVDASYPEKIDFIKVALQKQNLLQNGRLSAAPQWGGRPSSFFLEETVACPLIIPKRNLPEDLGLNAFRIWISDPNPNDLNGPKWSFRGSFLYLTELRFDNVEYNSVYSGCSALRFIANAVSGAPLLQGEEPERMGRDSANHPVDKLRSFGFVKDAARAIETLYRIRYMTDEQLYTYRGKQHRVHDILGYPLYIAAR